MTLQTLSKVSAKDLSFSGFTPEQFNTEHVSRRSVMRAGGVVATAMALWWPRDSSASQISNFARGREITLVGAHTGEKFKGEYWYDGRYSNDAFHEIKKFMRDHRTNEIFPIDPRLIDILFVIQKRLDKGPFELYSGYRSPATNARLRHETSGVARNSYHMTGQAADVGLRNGSTRDIRAQALAIQAGGVGFYSRSSFVHIDTGRFRTW